jgi:hypothetical protein
MQITKRSALPLAAAVALAAAPAAHAQDDAQDTTVRVTGGQTMLRLDAAVARALRANGVRVSLVRPARLGASGITFPATGGSVDPRSLAGTVEHRGGIRFRAGGRSLVVRDPAYRITEDGAILTVRAGRARIPLLNLDASNARVRQLGALSTGVSRIVARLTPTAARALNATFHTRLFRGGLRLGTVRSEPRFGDVVFSGGTTSLALDPGAAQALQQLGITASGTEYPITGGRVDARTLAGEITHSGGLTLTRGSTVVNLTDFTIAPPVLSGLVGGSRADLLRLDATNARVRVAGSRVIVSGVSGALTAGAAQALNQAFSTDAFREGLVLGTATVNGQAR